MAETFGSRLKRFALAVDIVDEDIFRQMWDLIFKYISDQLEPAYWALLAESEVNRRRGLSARESSRARNPSFSIRNEDGSYDGLAAYSFVEGKPLWVVSPDKETLGPDTLLQDNWSGLDNLPPFDKSKNEGIRTAIFVPLHWKESTLGLLDLQSRVYHEFTKKIAMELELLADAISVLLMNADTNQSRREQTLEAIRIYQQALKDDSMASLAKPQIFVASSNDADDMVMNTIISVLNEYEDQLNVHYWRDSSASGNITWEILKQIRASQFGLCYFSEPEKDVGSRFKYRDNSNVIFEAGMFQSLTNASATDHPTGWIPVREAQSPPAPFDFAQQRMIFVKRASENGSPELDELRDDLKRHIENLLE